VEGALRVVLSDAGRAQMEALRAEIGSLSDRERGRVAESIAERDRSFAFAFVLVGLSGLLATALATVAGIGTVRHQREARERAERALSAEEARYNALVEASSQLTWAMRPDGSLAFVSRSFGEYTGLGAGVVSAAEWTSLIHPDDRAPDGHLTCTRTGRRLRPGPAHPAGRWRLALDTGPGGALARPVREGLRMGRHDARRA
jgi:PAS domain-containing protein